MARKSKWQTWAEAIDGTTTVTGVMGWPVEHSLSPPVHNAAYISEGMNWVYTPMAVHPELVEEAIEGIRALSFCGMNVTIPHKTAVVEHLDELSDVAAALNTVNTIHVSDGRLIGYNTDGLGFVRSLREAGWSASDKIVTMIGAGGAAAAVALAVARDEKPARLVILNRTPEKADQVANIVRNDLPDLPVITGDLASGHSQDLIRQSEILIDCTSVGMYPEVDVDPVVPGELLNEDMVVCDLTYNPRETVLLKTAKNVGAATLEGTGMLLHQGASAYELWTGKDAPVEVMREALMDALEQREQIAR